jgi:hypothetical protein
MTKDEYLQRKVLMEKDRALWKKSRSRFIPGLPVDADAKEFRRKIGNIGSCVDGLLANLLKEQSPFFDEVVEKWSSLFPDIPAVPKQWSEEKLILHVPSSGQLFVVRSKLASIRKTLNTLSTAPKKWTIILKIAR